MDKQDKQDEQDILIWMFSGDGQGAQNYRYRYGKTLSAMERNLAVMVE